MTDACVVRVSRSPGPGAFATHADGKGADLARPPSIAARRDYDWCGEVGAVRQLVGCRPAELEEHANVGDAQEPVVRMWSLRPTERLSTDEMLLCHIKYATRYL